MKTYFKETQSFRQPWIWAILIATNALFVFIFIYEIVLGLQSIGTNPAPPAILIALMAIDLSLTVLLIFLRLETELTEEGVYYRFYPIQIKLRKIRWEQIANAYVRRFEPLREYGGWGLRGSFKGEGTAYTVSGSYGLQLVYTNNKKFLLGTAKANELRLALYELKMKFTAPKKSEHPSRTYLGSRH